MLHFFWGTQPNTSYFLFIIRVFCRVCTPTSFFDFAVYQTSLLHMANTRKLKTTKNGKSSKNWNFRVRSGNLHHFFTRCTDRAHFPNGDWFVGLFFFRRSGKSAPNFFNFPLRVDRANFKKKNEFVYPSVRCRCIFFILIYIFIFQLFFFGYF